MHLYRRFQNNNRLSTLGSAGNKAVPERDENIFRNQNSNFLCGRDWHRNL